MTKSPQKHYWLMKSEPSAYSIDDLARDKKTAWECVRNYQARNFMLHDMKLGDSILFYHSSAEPSGIVGLAEVLSPARPDKTQFEKKSEYFDPKATQAEPRWFCVDVGFQRKFSKVITLDDLHKQAALKDMMVLKRGQRLSIQPVTELEFATIEKMASP